MKSNPIGVERCDVNIKNLQMCTELTAGEVGEEYIGSGDGGGLKSDRIEREPTLWRICGYDFT